MVQELTVFRTLQDVDEFRSRNVPEPVSQEIWEKYWANRPFKQYKGVVLALVATEIEGEYWFYTQWRLVQNKAYDPLYDCRFETMGESLKTEAQLGESDSETSRDDRPLSESPMVGLYRGLEEEMGCEEKDIVRIVGGDNQLFSTGERDSILLFNNPYAVIQQIRGAQPWLCVGFIAVVRKDITPKNSDGEVGSYQLWHQDLLRETLKTHPEYFMGLHSPLLWKAVNDTSWQ